MYDTGKNTPKSEIDRRIANLKRQLEKNDIGAALFLQRADLLYFSGTIQEAHLFIPLEEEPVLMVYKNYDRAIAESSLSRIVSLESPRAIPQILRNYDYTIPQTIGMELDVLPVNLYRNYQRTFEECHLVDVSHLVRLVRATKSTYEINMIRQAAQLSDAVAAQVPALLR
ncbi:MAG: aminopeptidase P family N-terminal domain-containing protein, partial [Desulfobacterales bacterium]